MSPMDEVIRRLIFDAEIGLQLRQANDAAIFPPAELDAFRLNDVRPEEWLQSPLQ